MSHFSGVFSIYVLTHCVPFSTFSNLFFRAMVSSGSYNVTKQVCFWDEQATLQRGSDPWPCIAGAILTPLGRLAESPFHVVSEANLLVSKSVFQTFRMNLAFFQKEDDFVFGCLRCCVLCHRATTLAYGWHQKP